MKDLRYLRIKYITDDNKMPYVRNKDFIPVSRYDKCFKYLERNHLIFGELGVLNNTRIVLMTCPYCGNTAVLRNSNVLHHKHQYGEVYVCRSFPKCDAYVGCHKNTNVPLGRLADKELREIRVKTHKYFYEMQKNSGMTKSDAYKWLAKQLHLTLEECHIGMFSVNTCRVVIRLCKRNIDPKLTPNKGYYNRPIQSRGNVRKKKY